MWVFFNGASEWIETGAKNGAVGVSLTDQINQKLWAGHFLGFKLKDSSGVARFYNLAYGSPYPTGTHNYQNSKISSTSWAVYLNSARVLTIPRTINYPSAEGVVVGIESKDTTNSFRSGTYISNWQFINTSGN
ncbi:hypothetical protein [Synechocystis sp. PCC 7509]|uniref:hypothetical protein n=1 Tax=Synechocystis sp. PCC 7509 TaxID=927677 RepID=UPI0002ABDF10|nr:hypothetical protein [Synechocystis sp. PCC 7509]